MATSRMKFEQSKADKEIPGVAENSARDKKIDAAQAKKMGSGTKMAAIMKPKAGAKKTGKPAARGAMR